MTGHGLHPVLYSVSEQLGPIGSSAPPPTVHLPCCHTRSLNAEGGTSLDIAAHSPAPGTGNGDMPTPGVWMHSCSASPDSARNGEPVPNRAGIELSVPNQMEKRSGLTAIVLEDTDDPAPVHPQTICSVCRLGDGERTLMLLLVHDGAMGHR